MRTLAELKRARCPDCKQFMRLVQERIVRGCSTEGPCYCTGSCREVVQREAWTCDNDACPAKAKAEADRLKAEKRAIREARAQRTAALEKAVVAAALFTVEDCAYLCDGSPCTLERLRDAVDALKSHLEER